DEADTFEVDQNFIQQDVVFGHKGLTVGDHEVGAGTAVDFIFFGNTADFREEHGVVTGTSQNFHCHVGDVGQVDFVIAVTGVDAGSQALVATIRQGDFDLVVASPSAYGCGFGSGGELGVQLDVVSPGASLDRGDSIGGGESDGASACGSIDAG